jgi:hypothetical protein
MPEDGSKLQDVPIEIAATADGLVVLNPKYYAVRRIHSAGRMPLPPSAGSIMGTSKAVLDGDSLVIETTGLRDDTWLTDYGYPHSGSARITERWTLLARNIMEVRITVEDPKYYETPLQAVRLLSRTLELLPEIDFSCIDRLRPKGVTK